jgi:hypothetical protein
VIQVVPVLPVVVTAKVVVVVAPICGVQSPQVSGDEARRRAMSAAGRTSTNPTGGLGDSSRVQAG